MKLFQIVLKGFRSFWGSGSELPPELVRYCREEGVDPWTLAEGLRAAEAPKASSVPRSKKEAPTLGLTVRGPLSSVTN